MGIDYGMGMTNIDHETGIRYGVIHSNHCSPDAISDIYDNGDDLGWEAFKEEAIAQIKSALESTDLFGHGGPDDSDAEKIFDDFNLGDNYQPDGSSYRYEKDGYIIQLGLDGDMFVIKSPFVALRDFCSPCAPGACHLNTEGNVPCYCLGEDWFDEYQSCPYQPIPIADYLTGLESGV